MRMLEIYHEMLLERQQRTEFVVENHLTKWKQLGKFQKVREISCDFALFQFFVVQSLPFEEDRKMVSKLRPILQVTTKEKWDALMNGLLRESSLRRAIEYYGDLRKEGIRTEREVFSTIFLVEFVC